ncbi:MAG: hypothetical protein AB7F28_00440 [Candidatus Margulisiibacteriota bacterium]
MSISRAPRILFALTHVARPFFASVLVQMRRASDAAAPQPPKFRHMSPEHRRRALEAWHNLPVGTLDEHVVPEPTLNALYENVWGTFGMAFCAVPNVVINGKKVTIPGVTEEPSIVAALANASKVPYEGEGPSRAICTAQLLFVRQAPGGLLKQAINRLRAEENGLRALLQDQGPDKIKRLFIRGGGFAGPWVYSWLSKQMFVTEMPFDVREAMGANLVNIAAEYLGPKMAQILGKEWASRLHILTNNAEYRISTATQRIPIASLATSTLTGKEVAERMVDAYRFAKLNENRAITNNKGGMNGASALALATGQDIRGLEAAAHFYARNLGVNPNTGAPQYGPLASWAIEGDHLVGRVALPTPTTTVGRLVEEHPGVRLAFKLLGNPTNRDLGLYLAVAFLGSNGAALRALCTDGINAGHLRLHSEYKSKP